MSEKIDYKHPRFKELLQSQGIEYASTIHHFIEENGEVKAVTWSSEVIEKSVPRETREKVG